MRRSNRQQGPIPPWRRAVATLKRSSRCFSNRPPPPDVVDTLCITDRCPSSSSLRSGGGHRLWMARLPAASGCALPQVRAGCFGTVAGRPRRPRPACLGPRHRPRKRDGGALAGDGRLPARRGVPRAVRDAGRSRRAGFVPRCGPSGAVAALSRPGHPAAGPDVEAGTILADAPAPGAADLGRRIDPSRALSCPGPLRWQAVRGALRRAHERPFRTAGGMGR